MRDDEIQSVLYEPPSTAPPHAAGAPAGARKLAQSVKSLALGFVAGVAFWHLIGFWSFISQMAFNSDPSSRRVAELVDTPPATAEESSVAAPAPATKGSGPSKPDGAGEKVVLGAFDANCSSLVLDRKAGTVAAAPCLPSRLVLVDAGTRARQDLAVADLIERQLAERLGLSASAIETGSITATD